MKRCFRAGPLLALLFVTGFVTRVPAAPSPVHAVAAPTAKATESASPVHAVALSSAGATESPSRDPGRSALLESRRLLGVRPFDFTGWKRLLEQAYAGSAFDTEIAQECRRFALLLGDSLTTDSVMVVLDGAVRLAPGLAFDDSLLDLCNRLGRQPPAMAAERAHAAEKRIVVAPSPPPDAPKLGEFIYVEELPEAVTKFQPEYPASARHAKIDGTVLIQVLVGKDGRVADAKIVKSIPELDDAAVAAVRRWIFKPALSRGEPVAVWVAVPVKFTLEK